MARPTNVVERNAVALITAVWVLVLLAGFGRSFFFLPFFGDPPAYAARETLFYLHGAVMASWFGLLVTQVVLIRLRNIALHRLLGSIGGGVAVLVFCVGAYAALVAANRETGFVGVPFSPEQFLIVPLTDIVLFGLFVAGGFLKRRSAASHKRFMLLASVSLLVAAIARIPALFGAFIVNFELFVVAAMIALMLAWDALSLRRVHPVTLIGGAVQLTVMGLRLPLGESALWQGFATWMMALVV